MSHHDQLMCRRVREHKLLYNCKPFNATSPQWLPLASRIKASMLCEWVNSWIYQDMDSPTVACVFVLLAAGDMRDGCLANMSWDKCITNGWWEERKKERETEQKLNSLLCFLTVPMGLTQASCCDLRVLHVRTSTHFVSTKASYATMTSAWKVQF